MSWYDMLKNQIWDHNPFQPSDPAVRAAMDGTLPPLDFMTLTEWRTLHGRPTTNLTPSRNWLGDNE